MEQFKAFLKQKYFGLPVAFWFVVAVGVAGAVHALLQ